MMKKIAMFLLLFCSAQLFYAQNTNTSDYNMRKAYEMLDKNDEKEALKYINQQLKDDPASSDAYTLRARIFFNNENYGSALTDINRAIKHWKKGCEYDKYVVIWWRANIYRSLEMNDKAFDDFETVYRLAVKADKEEDIHDILYQRADLHFDLKDYDKADADYRLMLKHNESDQVAMIGLVRNMLERKEYQAAVDMADKCAKFDAAYSEIYRFRMRAYHELGESKKAINDALAYCMNDENPIQSLMEPILKTNLTYALAKVDEIVNKNPENVLWRKVRIVIHELGYNYEAALAEYNDVEKEFGASPDIYFYRSRLYRQLGDLESAVSDMTKCIEMSEERDLYMLAERAQYYQESGKLEESIADWTEIIKEKPTVATAYAGRGWCHELMGNVKEAMKDYDLGIEVDADYPYIYLYRGELHKKQGNEEAAVKDFEMILEKDTVADAGSCRQFALRLLGKDDEALAWMDKILAEDGEEDGAYYNQACLLSLMGKKTEALAALRTSMEKGYRSMKHMEMDDDLDAIRDMPEFKALIAEYEVKREEVVAQSAPKDEIGIISEVQMKKMYSGVYEVPCSINGLSLKFIFDTGASDVSISSVEASFMLKNGYLTKDDIKGKEYYSTATGEIHEGTRIRLREIKIGDALLKNVEASVVLNQQAPLLLGQSVLERFGTITIDNINSKLLIKQ
jgi:clan AA aspartic protease (TIGR02281 family)